MFLIVSIIGLLLIPVVSVIVVFLVSNMSILETINCLGPGWIFASPIWASLIAWYACAMGRTIEILETAKSVVSTAKSVQPHATSLYNYVTTKIKK